MSMKDDQASTRLSGKSTRLWPVYVARVFVGVAGGAAILTFVFLIILLTANVFFGYNVGFMRMQLSIQGEWDEGMQVEQSEDSTIPTVKRIDIPRLGFNVNAGPELTGRLYIIGLILLHVVLLFIIGNIWQLLKNVRRGVPFSEENSRRVYHIGWALTLLGPAAGLFKYILSLLYVSAIKVPGMHLSVYFEAHEDIVVVGLIVLVVALIFDHGLKLQRDQDLTI